MVYQTIESNEGTDKEKEKRSCGIKERITAKRGVNVKKRINARSRNKKIENVLTRKKMTASTRTTYQRTEGKRCRRTKLKSRIQNAGEKMVERERGRGREWK